MAPIIKIKVKRRVNSGIEDREPDGPPRKQQRLRIRLTNRRANARPSLAMPEAGNGTLPTDPQETEDNNTQPPVPRRRVRIILTNRRANGSAMSTGNGSLSTEPQDAEGNSTQPPVADGNETLSRPPPTWRSLNNTSVPSRSSSSDNDGEQDVLNHFGPLLIQGCHNVREDQHDVATTDYIGPMLEYLVNDASNTANIGPEGPDAAQILHMMSKGPDHQRQDQAPAAETRVPTNDAALNLYNLHRYHMDRNEAQSQVGKPQGPEFEAPDASATMEGEQLHKDQPSALKVEVHTAQALLMLGTEQLHNGQVQTPAAGAQAPMAAAQKFLPLTQSPLRETQAPCNSASTTLENQHESHAETTREANHRAASRYNLRPETCSRRQRY